MNDNQTGIILYQPDSSIQLEVRVEDETVWLKQFAFFANCFFKNENETYWSFEKYINIQ